jgi:Flp pilus assembly pilin Flp
MRATRRNISTILINGLFDFQKKSESSRKCTNPAMIPPQSKGHISPSTTGIGPRRGRLEKNRRGDANLSEPSEERQMLNFIKNFRADEDGAVTVDWVVLTAAIVGLGIAVLTSVSSGAETLATDISDELTSIDPNAGV